MYCVHNAIAAMTGHHLSLPPLVQCDDVPALMASLGLRFHEQGMPIPQSGIVFYRYTMSDSEHGHAEYTDDVCTYITQAIPAYAAQHGYTDWSIIAVAIR